MFIKLTEILNGNISSGVEFWVNANNIHVLEKKDYGTRCHVNAMINGEVANMIDVLESPEEIQDLIRRERNYGRK